MRIKSSHEQSEFHYYGHGSTRQLADSAGTVAAADNYSYDAYGMMLGSSANAENSAGTKYLYAGEQYDSSASMYYNRARYYDPTVGRFNTNRPIRRLTTGPAITTQIHILPR